MNYGAKGKSSFCDKFLAGVCEKYKIQCAVSADADFFFRKRVLMIFAHAKIYRHLGRRYTSSKKLKISWGFREDVRVFRGKKITFLKSLKPKKMRLRIREAFFYGVIQDR